MPTKAGRTRPCGITEARVRAAQGRKFLDTAELIADVDDDLATPGVAAALAVLAGVSDFCPRKNRDQKRVAPGHCCGECDESVIHAPVCESCIREHAKTALEDMLIKH